MGPIGLVGLRVVMFRGETGGDRRGTVAPQSAVAQGDAPPRVHQKSGQDRLQTSGAAF